MTRQTRRDILRASGVCAAAGISAGCNALSPVGPASASLDVQADGETISGSSESGEVSDVTVTVTGTADWSNLPDDADRVRVRATVSFGGGSGGPTIGDDVTTDLDSGSFDYAIESQPIVAQSRDNPVLDVQASDLSATEDGETKTTDATITVYAEVWSGAVGGGEQLLSESESVPLTIEVTNEPGNGSPAVSVTVDVSGTVEMS